MLLAWMYMILPVLALALPLPCSALVSLASSGLCSTLLPALRALILAGELPLNIQRPDYTIPPERAFLSWASSSEPQNTAKDSCTSPRPLAFP